MLDQRLLLIAQTARHTRQDSYHLMYMDAQLSLDVSRQEPSVKVAANGVIDEAFLSLGLPTSLIFEHYVVIPSPLYLQVPPSLQS